ncbi:MAG: TIGR00296 family protein [Candidatus Aenigmatarchaeota archaeon]
MNNKDGKELLDLARRSVEKYLQKKWKLEETRFKEKMGVFVSIHTINGELRGCIGYPYPVLPLGEAVQKAAISAAFEDPRFPPIARDELNRVVFEISVLTKPKLIEVKDPKDYLKEVRIGEDGIIIERGFYSGLLLPQVAIEHKLSVKEFLDHTCMKAGMNPRCWLDKDVKVYKFQAQIFKESKN